MKKNLILCCTAAIALAAASGASAATLVNVNAATNAGTVVGLTAGTYTVEFVGMADGGAYNAWNAWQGDTVGCNGAGENCSRGWLVNLAADFGSSGSFDRSNAYFYTQTKLPDNNFRFSTAEAALAQIQTVGDFIYAPAEFYKDPSAFTAFGGPITFTLSSDQDVNFFIQDSPLNDNVGGVSFVLNQVSSAVPEPASWALMIAGFGIAGLAMRRRPQLSFA